MVRKPCQGGWGVWCGVVCVCVGGALNTLGLLFGGVHRKVQLVETWDLFSGWGEWGAGDGGGWGGGREGMLNSSRVFRVTLAVTLGVTVTLWGSGFGVRGPGSS